jgi:hypothetical protein
MISPARESPIPGNTRLTAEEEWRYAEKALEWQEWGSPVGLGILAVSAGFLFAADGASVLFLHRAGLF